MTKSWTCCTCSGVGEFHSLHHVRNIDSCLSWANSHHASDPPLVYKRYIGRTSKVAAKQGGERPPKATRQFDPLRTRGEKTSKYDQEQFRFRNPTVVSAKPLLPRLPRVIDSRR